MRLGHFDLNLFVALDALLETASVTQASERLNIGVSAASSALGRLRQHFHDDLLVQVGRRMELTPLAHTLREPVRDLVLRSQATLATQAGFDPACEQRRFVFNVSDYAAMVLLVPLARWLEVEAPGLSFRAVGLGNSNVQALERGEIDVAIYPSVNASPDHPQETLLREDYSCVVWRNSAHTRESLSYAAYMAARHVAVEMGDRRVPTFESWFFTTHGVARNVVVTASTFAALPALVIGTQAIATMHSRLARLYERSLPIRLIDPPFEIPALELVMQWNRHHDADAGHVWLRQRLKALACEI